MQWDLIKRVSGTWAMFCAHHQRHFAPLLYALSNIFTNVRLHTSVSSSAAERIESSDAATDDVDREDEMECYSPSHPEYTETVTQDSVFRDPWFTYLECGRALTSFECMKYVDEMTAKTKTMQMTTATASSTTNVIKEHTCYTFFDMGHALESDDYTSCATSLLGVMLHLNTNDTNTSDKTYIGLQYDRGTYQVPQLPHSDGLSMSPIFVHDVSDLSCEQRLSLSFWTELQSDWIRRIQVNDARRNACCFSTAVSHNQTIFFSHTRVCYQAHVSPTGLNAAIIASTWFQKFGEIWTALLVCRSGGHVVVDVYDDFDESIVWELLWIISSAFEQTCVFSPSFRSPYHRHLVWMGIGKRDPSATMHALYRWCARLYEAMWYGIHVHHPSAFSTCMLSSDFHILQGSHLDTFRAWFACEFKTHAAARSHTWMTHMNSAIQQSATSLFSSEYALHVDAWMHEKKIMKCFDRTSLFIDHSLVISTFSPQSQLKSLTMQQWCAQIYVPYIHVTSVFRTWFLSLRERGYQLGLCVHRRVTGEEWQTTCMQMSTAIPSSAPSSSASVARINDICCTHVFTQTTMNQATQWCGWVAWKKNQPCNLMLLQLEWIHWPTMDSSLSSTAQTTAFAHSNQAWHNYSRRTVFDTTPMSNAKNDTSGLVCGCELFV